MQMDAVWMQYETSSLEIHEELQDVEKWHEVFGTRSGAFLGL